MHNQSIFNLQFLYFAGFQFVLSFSAILAYSLPHQSNCSKMILCNKPAWFASSKITHCWKLIFLMYPISQKVPPFTYL